MTGGLDIEGMLFDMDSFSVHDGPGIRLGVYFKGCPMACRWCHSPESQSPRPQLAFYADRCQACGACQAACRQGVHTIEAGVHRLDRRLCIACGACVGNCPRQALQIKGRRVRASEVIERATRLKPFFDHSGGGITLTGGEVTRQSEFAAAILAGCKAERIPTAIETSGCCRWEVMQRLLLHTDLVLYDLKLIDDDQHRQWTGQSNRLILANAARLRGLDVIVRVPLIPGVTDTQANLAGIFAFMASHHLPCVSLLPFNPSTAAKYEWLGRSCDVHGRPQDPSHLAAMAEMAQDAGLEVAIG